MKTSNVFLFVSLGVLLSSPTWAATTTINCSSSSTVQSALNSAASGDTVRCSGSGWSSGSVSIPGGKDITLDGAGVTVSGNLNIPSSANNTARVTNFTFGSTGRYAIQSGDGITNKPWRFDHCTFAGGTVAVMGLGSGPGLIDHLTAVNMGFAQQMIEPIYEGADSTAGWANAVTPGSPNAIYIEDSTFTHPGSIWDGASVFQQYYGARVVARYNTLNASMLEVHGSPGAEGGRWWEFYNNRFTNGAICIRAGSGIIFNNTGSTQFFAMLEEDSGYPALYQVGRGQNQTLYPAYVWGNTLDPSLNAGGLCSNAAANMVQLNRDVYIPTSGTTLPGTCTVNQGFWKTDVGGNWDTTNSTANDGALYKCTATNQWTQFYVPYTYPHPLQSGGGGGGQSPPSAPTSLVLAVH